MTAPFSFTVTRTLIPARGKLAHMWKIELTTSDGQSVRFYDKFALTNEAALTRAIDNDMLIAPEL